MFTKTALLVLVASLTYAAEKGPGAEKGQLAEKGPESDKKEQLADIFDSIDKDNDNLISLDEAKKFYTAVGIPVADIEAEFKLADKDGDGKLSEEEFLDYTN